jgi:hypothetical protein
LTAPITITITTKTSRNNPRYLKNNTFTWLDGRDTNQSRDYNGGESTCTEALPYLGNKENFIWRNEYLYMTW